MPGGDRTGPRGEGPRTGWGMGLCNDVDQPATASLRPNSRMGRGFRRGGRGRDWRNRVYESRWPERVGLQNLRSPADQNQDLESLKTQANKLSETLKEVQSRLDNLES